MTRRQALWACAGAGLLRAQPALVPLDEAAYQKMVSSQRGKVLLVNFWATWCAPCRKEMPALVKLEQSLKDKGLALATVSADEPEQEQAARAFLQQVGVRAPLYIRRAKDDDKFIAAIESSWSGALPASFVYDRQGRKVSSFIGEVSMKELEAAIRKVL